jgi:glyoxylase-like metal-dependent hydrolase (beta-lactamase superfamily II)
MQIHTIDLNYQHTPHAIAAYLVMGSTGPVLVETGPMSTLQNLVTALGQYHVTPSDIKHLLVTHIHLDHAGAAGWWAQQGTQVYVHHVGAPHLIDPSKLLASASRIYGDKMDSMWGQTVPAPAEKVTILYDGDVVEVCGLSFTAIDTPGHAWHHHAFKLGGVGFVGDAAGMHLPDAPLVDMPAPPPEFHLDTWLQTIDKLAAHNFEAIYPTHFGRVDNVAEHLGTLKVVMKDAAVYIRQQMEAGHTQEQIIQLYNGWNRQRAKAAGATDEVIRQYETANPWYMSVQGIMRYWQKQGVGNR